MFAPSFPIVTERLTLRPFREGDGDWMYGIRSREDVNRFLYSPPLTRQEADDLVDKRRTWRAFEREGDWLALAIEVTATGEMVGDVVLGWLSAEHRQGEVGFVLDPERHGHGYATEAAAAMLGVGFDGLGLHRIVARCDGRNAASTRVMERLGMRREAHLVENEYVKGEWTDEIVYAMLESEWAGR